MEFVDTHAHIQEDAFEPDRAEVLSRARAAGVRKIIVVGFTVDSSRRAVELAEQDPNLFAVVGIQPNYVLETKPSDWDTIMELVKSPSVVGIGETGLDRYWKTAPIELQAGYFQRHIRLSRELNLPFVVHCRDAEQEVIDGLRKAAAEGPLQGVMHSFSGNTETAQACWELGLHISFSGMVVAKGNKVLRAAAAVVPADRILIETDCPYLAPSPNRGKRNEPSFVTFTAACIAEARGMDVNEFAALTTANAERLFKLSKTK